MTHREPRCDIPLQRDPYLFFEALRSRGPLVWHEPTASWYATTHALTSRLLLNANLSALSVLRLDVFPEGTAREVVREVDEFFNQWLVFSESPRQMAIRRTVTRAYNRQGMLAWRRSIRQLCESSVDDLCAPVEMVEAFAIPFALSSLGLFLGLPQGAMERLRGWSENLMAFLTTIDSHVETAHVAKRAIGDIRRFVQDELRHLAEDPSASPQTRVFAAMSDEDAVSFFAQVLTGSLDPIVSCLGTLVSVLFSPSGPRPGSFIGDLEAARIVEEALRFDAPFHFAPRTALIDFEEAGARVCEGDRVLIVLAAANRDPSVYEKPSDFVISRNEAPHLSFGIGHHYCLGATIARTVLSEAVLGLYRWRHRVLINRIESVRAPSFGTTKWDRVNLYASEQER